MVVHEIKYVKKIICTVNREQINAYGEVLVIMFILLTWIESMNNLMKLKKALICCKV